MARNSRWENQARYDNQDNPDSIRYARYENEPTPRNVYYDKQPQRQMQRDIDEQDYRDMRYNRLNDNIPPHQPQPQQQSQRQHHDYPQRKMHLDQDEQDYRESRYNRYNQEKSQRAIQDYPLPLTLPVPLAVPAALEYEPIIEEPLKSELLLEDDWSNGLCDCCSDWGGCCFAFWCMPCFLCSFDKDSKECCCTTVGLSCCFGIGICNAIMMQRAKLRGAYQINGSIFEDFCLTCFCCFCVLLQLHNEMGYRGDAM